MSATTTDIRQSRETSRWGWTASLLQRQGALAALVALILFGVLRYGENFYSEYNIQEILRYNAMFGLIALGMTFVIMTGGIDLSVGATAALSSVVLALLSPHGAWIAIFGAVGAGLAVGLINGTIISFFRIQPFIVTLAMLLAARGVALFLADNTNVYVDFESGFMDIDREQIGPVPMRVAILIAAFAIGSVLLNFTRFGRHVLAVGGNEEAARLAGLPIGRILLAVYAMSGGLAGLAGVLLAWQTATGAPTEGIGWELSAIAAVVIGGTLLTGGMGSVGTTLVGAILLGLIFNILNFENGKGVISLSSYWQTVIRGLILLIVVLLQNRLGRRLVNPA
ncbi:MAG: ABC transporter permease [Chloroflexota bacterium]|nr:ABC transporter permease [Chloroflexota bacterium]